VIGIVHTVVWMRPNCRTRSISGAVEKCGAPCLLRSPAARLLRNESRWELSTAREHIVLLAVIEHALVTACWCTS